MEVRTNGFLFKPTYGSTLPRKEKRREGGRGGYGYTLTIFYSRVAMHQKKL